MSHFYQGDYKPENPKKYVGNKLPHYRSSWERRVFYYMDKCENVVAWGSEPLAIEYVNPLDGRRHRYFPDIVCRVKQKDGKLKDFMLEIKPKYQSEPARVPKRKTAKAVIHFVENQQTYTVNQAKWDAAMAYCNPRNIEFKVITEEQLGLI